MDVKALVKTSMAAVPLQPKSAKKRRKSRARFTVVKKVKAPGFDAFQVTQKTSEGYEETKVVSPEHGIHSALATPSQSSSFLRLPNEVRNKIYELALQNICITLHKSGKKFTSTGNGNVSNVPIAINIYQNLSLVSRQLYVDIVGGALLYKCVSFSFISHMFMKNYLSAINPAHKAAIRAVQVHVSLTQHNPCIPTHLFKVLATLSSLQSLRVILYVAPLHSAGLCERILIDGRWYRTLKQHIIDRNANEKQWVRLRGGSLVSINVDLECAGPIWKANPRMVAFRDFVRGVVGVDR